MNNRIKELVMLAEYFALDKANATDDEDFEYSFDDDFKEKFAELIIRDVVSTIKQTQVVSSDFEWAILNNYNLELDDEELEDGCPCGHDGGTSCGSPNCELLK